MERSLIHVYACMYMYIVLTTVGKTRLFSCCSLSWGQHRSKTTSTSESVLFFLLYNTTAHWSVIIILFTQLKKIDYILRVLSTMPVYYKLWWLPLENWGWYLHVQSYNEYYWNSFGGGSLCPTLTMLNPSWNGCATHTHTHTHMPTSIHHHGG